MDWDSAHKADFKSTLTYLTFDHRPVKCFELEDHYLAAPGSKPIFKSSELNAEDDVFQWLERQAKPPIGVQSSGWSLRILALERAPPNQFEQRHQSSGSSLMDVGLSDTNFIRLFRDFKIAKSFVHTLQYGQSMYSFEHPSEYDEVRKGSFVKKSYSYMSFNLRTSPVMLNDKAMTIHYDESTGKTFVLLQGCSSDDIEKMQLYLRTMQRYGGHPLLMVAIFIDMLHRYLRDYYFELRSLYVILSRVAFHQPDKAARDHRKELEEASQQYEMHLTEESELKALQLRLNRFIETLDLVNKQESVSGDKDKDKYMMYYGGRMIDRLKILLDEIEYLQSKCASQKDGLQLLISSMNSIVSISESRISRQISVASKRDSTVMMAIAVGTMLFLPITAMASIFAMPFLPWNKEQDDGKDRRPLLIYLTLSLPLTAVTLTSTILWMWAVDYEAEGSHMTLKPEARKLLTRMTNILGKVSLPTRKRAFTVEQTV